MIAPLLESLRHVTANLKSRTDIVFVDDGSLDGTVAALQKEATVQDKETSNALRWRLIKLARNFGQQAAYRAGLDYARGGAIVFLDADLQDPPEKIAELEAAWLAGAKVVIGVREGRQEKGLRRWCFDLFHFAFDKLTAGAMPRNSGTFGLMDRCIAEQLKQLNEVNLFLPALRCWFGYDTRHIYYQRQARYAGEEKQTFGKLFSYAWDGITSFSNIPLRMITVLGCAVAIPSFLYGAWLIVQRLLQLLGFFQSLEVLGFTTLAVAIFFMGGVQLICLGIFGEYLAKLFTEIKHRPVYIVEQVFEADEREAPCES